MCVELICVVSKYASTKNISKVGREGHSANHGDLFHMRILIRQAILEMVYDTPNKVLAVIILDTIFDSLDEHVLDVAVELLGTDDNVA